MRVNKCVLLHESSGGWFANDPVAENKNAKAVNSKTNSVLCADKILYAGATPARVSQFRTTHSY